MIKIEIKQGEKKIPIPTGIYVNGYIINVPVCPNQKNIVKYKQVDVINDHNDYKEKKYGNT